MANWNEIVTDRNLTLDDASKFLMQQTKPELLHNRYHITATWGSSGIRGLFPWSIEEFNWFVATFFRFQFRDGFVKGNHPDLITAAITSERPVHLSRFVFTVPIIPKMQILLLPATMPISGMIAELNATPPSHLIGYSTEIYRLAQEACRGKLKISPCRVSVNSEPLLPEMLETLRIAPEIISHSWLRV